MSERRKSIKLFPNERQALEDVYLKWGFAVDSYEQLPEELEAMVEEWRQRCGRSDPTSDVFHYIRNARKCKNQGQSKGWVRFDGKHKTPAPMPSFTADEVETLVLIYSKLVACEGHGSDNLAYDPALMDLIAKEFAESTGRVVPPHYLCAKLTALRKRGLLTEVTPKKVGFKDMDEVAQSV